MRFSKLLCATAVTATLAACAGDYEPQTAAPPPPPPPPPSRPAPELPPPPPPEPTVVPRQGGKVAGRHVGGAAAQMLKGGDQAMLERTTQQALDHGEAGKPVKWSNPETGSRGSVTPQPRFTMQGKSCREFQQSITVDGRTSTGYGAACQAPDGTWLLESF
jgi:surface antigen